MRADDRDIAERLLSLDPSAPRAGEVWKHCRGDLYDVIAVALREEDLVQLVVYRSQEKGTVWVRTLADWQERICINGLTCAQRFERVLGGA